MSLRALWENVIVKRTPWLSRSFVRIWPWWGPQRGENVPLTTESKSGEISGRKNKAGAPRPPRSRNPFGEEGEEEDKEVNMMALKRAFPATAKSSAIAAPAPQDHREAVHKNPEILAPSNALDGDRDGLDRSI